MVKQLGLGFFTPKPSTTFNTASLPPTILSLLGEGWGVRQIARKLGKAHTTILYHLGKMQENGLILHEKGSWIVKYPLPISKSGVVERIRSGVVVGSLLGSESHGNGGVWEAHHVKFSARVRKRGSLEALGRVASGSVGNWVFKRAGVTLTLHRRVVQVAVATVPGETVKEVLKRAELVMMPTVRLFERETGFRFSAFEPQKGLHWVLRKELSAPFLRVVPELADSSHPEQVELHLEPEKSQIHALISGSLLKRIEDLELVVKTQVLVIDRLVGKLEEGFKYR